MEKSHFTLASHVSTSRIVQMNLLRPCLQDNQFDVVLCNGVLHHLKDAYGGFQSIAQLVRPGGYIIIGLYNRYGRLATNARQIFFRLTTGRLRWIDSHPRKQSMSEAQQEAWFAAQYRDPQESKHTIDQVMHWFDVNCFAFVNALPKVRFQDQFGSNESLFEPCPKGTRLERFLAQLKMVVTGNREGGFFIMIGQKKEESE